MTARPAAWQPFDEAPVPALVTIRGGAGPPELVACVARIASALAVPVQAVRADRVLSRTHVAMAAEHARRARAAGRERATDPAVEFLLYLAAARQIHVAMAALGVPRTPAVPVLLVALGPVTPQAVAAQAETAGLVVAAVGDAVRFDDETARRWWQEQLPGARGDHANDVEARILARLAVLAVH